MLLSRNKILEHIKLGNIFISPFYLKNLGTTSYDVRLGENFFEEQPFRAADQQIFNPFDPTDIQKYWGKPKKAIRIKDWKKKHFPLDKVKNQDRIIVIGPGETILAHTEEFIGGRYCISTEMRAKSSMGRIGITVCKCAGWGDVGYCNRWTMEMTNHLKGAPIPLLVGMRVAQLIFYQVDPLEETYATTGGRYQNTDDTEKMIKNWSPYSMLPKFDRENY